MSRKAKSLTLTEEGRQQLRQIDERGSDWRERRRARTLLLLDKGLSIDAVVTQQKIHRDTVADHRDAWLARSFAGLRDMPRSGAPRKLSEAHKEVLCAWAKAEACTAPGLRSRLSAEQGGTGIVVAGAERLEREGLRVEENPAQSKKEARRREISRRAGEDSGIG